MFVDSFFSFPFLLRRDESCAEEGRELTRRSSLRFVSPAGLTPQQLDCSSANLEGPTESARSSTRLACRRVTVCSASSECDFLQLVRLDRGGGGTRRIRVLSAGREFSSRSIRPRTKAYRLKGRGGEGEEEIRPLPLSDALEKEVASSPFRSVSLPRPN